MIDVAQAFQIIQAHVKDFGTESIPLADGLGRILREDWTADRDFPPFNRVAMDGIAIDFESFKTGQRVFEIVGMAAAGAPQSVLQNKTQCLEVMTGAVLPKGTNAVIRYEDLEIEGTMAKITIEVTKAQNIHQQGTDQKKGSLLVPSGTKLSPAEIGVGATIGKAQIVVARLPKVLIISSGDELVDIHQTPLPHQIRKSNESQIAATLRTHGVQADVVHLLDDYETIVEKLGAFINSYEVIILSGGVSKGKFDFFPKALEQLGVQQHFHGVFQRPGKPFWFGTHANGCLVFALPGNPVSSFMCTQVYALDWLQRCLSSFPQKRPSAVLASAFHFKPDLAYFLQVKIEFREGQMLAHPVVGNGSGDLANLLEGDAFMFLPRGKDHFEKGESYPIYFYRQAIW